MTRRQPAEWTRHQAVWIGWPSAAELWGDDLTPARAEVEALVRAIIAPQGSPAGPIETLSGEAVELLVRGAEARAAAEEMRSRLGATAPVRLHDAPIGDIWLRDTGPIFTVNEGGALGASAFRFNGWGGKYQLPNDNEIAGVVAGLACVELSRFDGLVAEGGALEGDGEGTFITTRQCLLNKNRNPGATEKEIEATLHEAVGAEKVIWLDEGLVGDHTDGHVDNLARFIAPAKVVCMRPTGNDDPNKEVFERVQRTLEAARDAAGRVLEVITVPSPGRVELDNQPAAASHMNFYLSNQALIMPSYVSRTGNDEAAVEALTTLKRHVQRAYFFSIDSSHLLTGGGSFHCITQQQPSV